MLINGTVRDASGTLPNANVYFTDASGNYDQQLAGTTADLDGNFQLSGTGSHVTASYLGYKTQTKAAASRINFLLTSETYDLPEIIVSAKMVWPRILAGFIIIAAAWFIYKKMKK
jgi:hypothetical protein